MSDGPSPYTSPKFDSEGKRSSDGLSFGQTLSRGFGAANKTLFGALMIFIIIGPMQITSTISGALVAQGAIQPPVDGAPPSPELLMIMGIGCFTCVWFGVFLFGMPWAIGGNFGQIRDRIAGSEVGGYGGYGKQFYGRILLLIVIYLGFLMVLFIPLTIGSMILNAGQMQPGEFDPEKLRAMNQQPLNIALGVLFYLALTAGGTLLNLAQASLIVDDCKVMEAIGKAFGFVARQFGDTFKLFLVYVVISIPMMLSQQAGNWLPTITVPIMAGIGLFTAVYLGYVSVLNSGIGTSLYMARQPEDKPIV